MLNLLPRPTAPRLLFALSLFIGVSSAGPQTPAQAPSVAPAPGERNTRTVYVAALDKKGAPVTDLKSEHISLYEDKFPQKVESVSPAAESHIVLGVMIDLSGSTAEDAKRHEKLNVFLRFLASAVGSSEEAYVSAFAMSARRLTRITTNTNEIWSGLKQVDEARRFGPTAVFDSLVSAADSVPPDATGRKVLAVFSDFEDNSSRQNLEKTIQGLQLTGTSVFALVDISRRDKSPRSTKRGIEVAKQIAEETGGESYSIETPQELEAALQRMQLVLKNSYAITYHATAQPKKDGSVPLKIESRRHDVQLLYSHQRPPATP